MNKEWKEIILEEALIKITDGAHHSPKAYKNGIPMFSVKDMTENGFSYESPKTISEEDYEKLVNSGCQPQIDDILIAKDGSVLKHIFRVKSKPNYVLLSSIAIIRPNQEIIDSQYLVYKIKDPVTKDLILSNFVGGSGVPRIILKDFKKIELTISPLSEQKAIAEVLSSLDDKIDLLHRQNTTLEEMAETLFRKWFVEEADESWEEVKISDFGKVVTGKTPSKNTKNSWGDKFDFVTPTDFKNFGMFTNSPQRYLSDSGWDKMKNLQLPKKTILVTCIGADMGKISITSNICITNQQINSIILKEELYLGYVYEFIKSKYNLIRSIAFGGTTMPIINKTDFSNIDIPFPSKDIISKYNKIWNSCSNKIYNNQTQIQTLENLRNTLLPKLMSGEIRVV